MTPMWAKPSAPPPSSTRPMRGLLSCAGWSVVAVCCVCDASDTTALSDIFCAEPAMLESIRADATSGFRNVERLIAVSPMSLHTASDLQNDRHNHRTTARTLLDITLQVGANLLFNQHPVTLLFGARLFERPMDDLACFVDKGLLIYSKAAGNDLRCTFEQPCHLADGDNRHDKPCFAEVLTVADDEFFNDIGG